MVVRNLEQESMYAAVDQFVSTMRTITKLEHNFTSMGGWQGAFLKRAHSIGDKA